ncbi:(3R)-3-hydroxyacyl-CoA dehydrogenase-like [Oratosquilla oratoria]|uniref:(3R)-3-hydroxyacyl-CoA dehydrogenase-like n=1 Tax=Oratosquilla oratoria TaxID=337810 RepID=UPI003F76E98B
MTDLWSYLPLSACIHADCRLQCPLAVDVRSEDRKMAAAILSGKIALVTGGGSGIGREICKVLARDGARVVIGDRNGNAARETRDLLINPDTHMDIVLDVKERESVMSAIHATVKKYSSPPSLAANAAGITKDNFLLKMDDTSFMDVIDVNLKGTYIVTQIVAGALLQAGINEGSIVNISSLVAKNGNIGQSNYAASKAGVIAFSQTAAKELSRLGIRVNALLPGFIETPMVKTVPDKLRDRFLTLISAQRFGKPEEIAEVVSFLLSNKSSYITGAAIEVTGGLNF